MSDDKPVNSLKASLAKSLQGKFTAYRRQRTLKEAKLPENRYLFQQKVVADTLGEDQWRQLLDGHHETGLIGSEDVVYVDKAWLDSVASEISDPQIDTAMHWRASKARRGGQRRGEREIEVHSK